MAIIKAGKDGFAFCVYDMRLWSAKRRNFFVASDRQNFVAFDRNGLSDRKLWINRDDACVSNDQVGSRNLRSRGNYRRAKENGDSKDPSSRCKLHVPKVAILCTDDKIATRFLLSVSLSGAFKELHGSFVLLRGSE